MLTKEIQEQVNALVSDWPPFTPAQRDALAALLRPAGGVSV